MWLRKWLSNWWMKQVSSNGQCLAATKTGVGPPGVVRHLRSLHWLALYDRPRGATPPPGPPPPGALHPRLGLLPQGHYTPARSPSPRSTTPPPGAPLPQGHKTPARDPSPRGTTPPPGPSSPRPSPSPRGTRTAHAAGQGRPHSLSGRKCRSLTY